MKNNIDLDLWPNIDIEGPKDVPLKILREQAEKLSEKTKGLVYGDISTNSNKGFIFHTLYLVAPNLDNYRYSLLSIAHGVMPFPVFIYNHNLKNKEIIKVKKTKKYTLPNLIFPFDEYVLSEDSVPEPDLKALTIEEFISEIKKIFQSDETKGILQSLISQSKEN